MGVYFLCFVFFEEVLNFQNFLTSRVLYHISIFPFPILIVGSLEDLVSTFDEKLTMCFQDFQEEVDKIAPVQVSVFRISYFLMPGSGIQNAGSGSYSSK